MVQRFRPKSRFIFGLKIHHSLDHIISTGIYKRDFHLLPLLYGSICPMNPGDSTRRSHSFANPVILLHCPFGCMVKQHPLLLFLVCLPDLLEQRWFHSHQFCHPESLPWHRSIFRYRLQPVVHIPLQQGQPVLMSFRHGSVRHVL